MNSKLEHKKKVFFVGNFQLVFVVFSTYIRLQTWTKRLVT